jgi:hypothetical protein
VTARFEVPTPGGALAGFLAMPIAAAAPERVAGYVPIEATVPAGDSGMSITSRGSTGRVGELVSSFTR